MRFTSLGSGSRGNATVVHSGDSLILIDCGFSVRETEKRLARVGLGADDLTAILVTHEHADHIRGVLPLARKHQLTVMMTTGTCKTLKDYSGVNLEPIISDSGFRVGGLDVMPVSVPHDAREPVQYVLRSAGVTLGVLTDLGSITPHVVSNFSCCDGLLLEANHDIDMLANGSYPQALKNRVGGDWGHLNNYQTRHLLHQVQLSQLQHLVLGHISQQNNSLGQVKEAMAGLDQTLPPIHYASQEQNAIWHQLQAG
ncbi:MAG: phosphoribosyl 1,2-cyclic phosphodiesterase [Porticoccus sp.]|jgi:phosphoribosyl 1,2-cyclic phosphodiesterase